MPAPRISPVFRVHVEADGKLRWYGIERKRFDTLARKFAGKDADVVLRLPEKKSTDRQRRYYWPVIVGMICEASGHGPEDAQAIHEFLKGMFLKDNSGPIPITKSTEKLTTAEREEYHENCRRWAAGEPLFIYIPLPNEVDLESITA